MNIKWNVFLSKIFTFSNILDQEGKVGSQYLRQCESKKFATAMITAKLKTHGVVTVETDTLLCDADGSYGAYAIRSGM